MEKKERQEFSKIVRASKLTRQSILQININYIHPDRSRWQLTGFARSEKKTFSFAVSLQKQKRALRFLLEGREIQIFDVFFWIIDATAYKKIKTMIYHVSMKIL